MEGGPLPSINDTRVDCNKGSFRNDETRNKLKERFGALLLDAVEEVEPRVPRTAVAGPAKKKTRKTMDLSTMGSDEDKIYARLKRKVDNAIAIVGRAEPVAGRDANGNPRAMKEGDVLLFLGDFLHFGPQVVNSDDRLYLFVPYRIDGQMKDIEGRENEGDAQLHSIQATELLYGRDSAENMETIFAFMKALEAEAIPKHQSDMLALHGDWNDAQLWRPTSKKQIENMDEIWMAGKAKEKQKWEEEKKKTLYPPAKIVGGCFQPSFREF